MVDLDEFVEKCKLALDSTDPASTVEASVLEAIADPERLRARDRTSRSTHHIGHDQWGSIV